MIDLREWSRLDYHPQQAQLWRDSSRLIAVAAGRGSGKTTLARRRVVAYLPVRKPWSRPMYAYCLPTIKRAKRVAWPFIKSLIPKSWLAAPLNNNMVVHTVWGSELYVTGLDDPTVIEGDQWDGIIIDEAADQKPDWPLSVLPALAHRRGWLWLIGVPKRFGRGAALFKKLYNDPEWSSYTWRSDSVLSESDLQYARSTMSLKDYREQFEATWESAGGSAFYAFDRDHNVRPCAYDAAWTLVTGMDFNVNPMAWVHGHRYEGRLEVTDETFKFDTNTRQTLDSMWSRYSHHKGSFAFYGDASSRARKTSASSSDYAQIANDPRFSDKIIRFPRSNPLIKDRLAACNALLCNANGERRLHIDPRCQHLIEDLERRAINDYGEFEDRGEVGHITDALGYIVHAMFPVKVRVEHPNSMIGAAR